MVTHTFPIDEAPEAFDTMFSLRGGKVLIRPWSD
jgi:threonine dehydrogenase-like Zn-dependent dehydrogenase